MKIAKQLTFELPFATLTDEELINISSLNVEVPSYSAFSSMYFLTEDYADKFYSDVKPAYICQNSSMICNYYDFDEDLMNTVAR